MPDSAARALASADVVLGAWDSHDNTLSSKGSMPPPQCDCHQGLLRGAAGCSLDGKNGSQSKVSWVGIVSGGAGSLFVMIADALNVRDSQDNALSNRGGMPTPR